MTATVAPGGVDIEFTGEGLTQGGKPVVLNEVYDPETGKTTISGYVDNDGNGYDEGDLPVFSLVLDPQRQRVERRAHGDLYLHAVRTAR